jgi:hypothetical protein
MVRIITVLAVAMAAGLMTGRAGGAAGHNETRREFIVPKHFGTFKAVYHDQLLFEDDRGTIRSVYPNSATVVFTITRR